MLAIDTLPFQTEMRLVAAGAIGAFHHKRSTTVHDAAKARQILDAARLYSQVAKFVNGSGRQQFLMPSQVVAALSLELYFKCLFFMENDADFKVNGRHSHDFALLFEALTEEARKDIETAFQERMSVRKMDDIMRLEEFGNMKIRTSVPKCIEDMEQSLYRSKVLVRTQRSQEHGTVS